MVALNITDLSNGKLNLDHIDELANSAATTAVDRFGAVKTTVAGAIDSLKAFNSRGAWAPSTVYARKDLVTNGGQWYACVEPHTSSAAFATDSATKWRVHQGITAAEVAASAGASLVGFIQSGSGPIARTAQDKLRESVSIKDFGAIGNGIADDTAAILAAKAYAIANLPMRIMVPRGTYLYTDIGNWAYSGLTLEGENHLSTIFKCTGSGSAFVADAFKPGFTGNDATAPYVQAMNVKNITFKGSATTAIIVELQGISRCAWENVFAAEGEPTAGIAIRMYGVQLSSFYNIGCSTNLAAMVSKPYEGIRIGAGTRNSINVGNSSNLTFVNWYTEGLSIGTRLSGIDNSVFVSGASEANSVYDLLVAAGCREVTFICAGFESLTVTANVNDAGEQTKYINCYANKSFILAGKMIVIDSGQYHRIETTSTAEDCLVQFCKVKNWDATFPGTGGFFDNASAQRTRWFRLKDAITGQLFYPYRPRLSITVGATPFQWQNNTGGYVEVYYSGGTVTQILNRRGHVAGVGGDIWTNPLVVPSKHLVAPGDIIETSFSSAPTMFYVPHNGF